MSDVFPAELLPAKLWPNENNSPERIIAKAVIDHVQRTRGLTDNPWQIVGQVVLFCTVPFYYFEEHSPTPLNHDEATNMLADKREKLTRARGRRVAELREEIALLEQTVREMELNREYDSRFYAPQPGCRLFDISSKYFVMHWCTLDFVRGFIDTSPYLADIPFRHSLDHALDFFIEVYAHFFAARLAGSQVTIPNLIMFHLECFGIRPASNADPIAPNSLIKVLQDFVTVQPDEDTRFPVITAQSWYNMALFDFCIAAAQSVDSEIKLSRPKQGTWYSPATGNTPTLRALNAVYGFLTLVELGPMRGELAPHAYVPGRLSNMVVACNPLEGKLDLMDELNTQSCENALRLANRRHQVATEKGIRDTFGTDRAATLRFRTFYHLAFAESYRWVTRCVDRRKWEAAAKQLSYGVLSTLTDTTEMAIKKISFLLIFSLDMFSFKSHEQAVAALQACAWMFERMLKTQSYTVGYEKYPLQTYCVDSAVELIPMFGQVDKFAAEITNALTTLEDAVVLTTNSAYDNLMRIHVNKEDAAKRYCYNFAEMIDAGIMSFSVPFTRGSVRQDLAAIENKDRRMLFREL